MKLLIKQRVFSWTDTYDVYDENVCEASKYIAPLPSAPSDNQGGIYTK